MRLWIWDMFQEEKLIRQIMNAVLLIYPASVLTFRIGANTVGGLLAILALLYVLVFRSRLFFERKEKLLFGVLGFYFLVAFVAWLLHGMTHEDWIVLGRYARFLLFIPLYLLMRRFRFAEGSVWWGVAIGAVVAGCVAIYQKWLDPALIAIPLRVQGDTHHPIIFGDLSLALAVLSQASYSYFSHRGRRWLLIPVLALGFGLLASLLSGSRGGWVALPVVAVLLFWHWRQGLKPWQRWGVAVGSVMLLASVYVIPQTGVATRIAQAAADVELYQKDPTVYSSVGARLAMWEAAAEIFRRYPFTGVGLDGYKATVKGLVKEGIAPAMIGQFGTPHDEFLTVLVSTGFFGLVSLLLVFLVPLWYLFAATGADKVEVRRAGLAGVLLIVAFMHFGLTESVFERATPISFFTFFLTVFLALVKNHQYGLMRRNPK